MAAWAAWRLGHLDKPEAFGASRVPVGNDLDLLHRTVRLKELAERLFRGTIRKVPYKDIHATILDICNMETIARSSEPYAGAQGQHNVQERRRRDPMVRHLSYLFIGMITECYQSDAGVARKKDTCVSRLRICCGSSHGQSHGHPGEWP